MTVHPSLAHVENWIFDLDNTLYPPECGLLKLVDGKMQGYVASLLDLDDDTAHHVQKGYFHRHGTTMAGLIAEHAIDPHHYLAAVHDIDFSGLSLAPSLRASLEALPGRKIVFTNADAPYAERVLDGLGLDGIFDALCDIHDMALLPKPQESAYQALLSKTGIDPARSLFVEDMARNLGPAKALGMTTVWINNGSEQAGASPDPAHIDIEISRLADWLSVPHLAERVT